MSSFTAGSGWLFPYPAICAYQFVPFAGERSESKVVKVRCILVALSSESTDFHTSPCACDVKRSTQQNVT